MKFWHSLSVVCEAQVLVNCTSPRTLTRNDDICTSRRDSIRDSITVGLLTAASRPHCPKHCMIHHEVRSTGLMQQHTISGSYGPKDIKSLPSPSSGPDMRKSWKLTKCTVIDVLRTSMYGLLHHKYIDCELYMNEEKYILMLHDDMTDYKWFFHFGTTITKKPREPSSTGLPHSQFFWYQQKCPNTNFRAASICIHHLQRN